MLKNFYRHTFADINLRALRNNYLKIKEHTGTYIMPVIKADAYGHNAVETAKALESENADIFGVATIEEGIQLRNAAIKTPILILGSIYPMENFNIVLDYGLTPIVASNLSAKVLERIASERGVIVKVHIKVDSGMGRIGVNLETAMVLWEYVRISEHLECEGIFSHLARAEEDINYTLNQIKEFKKIIEKIDPPEYVHIANTAGLIKYPESFFNLVRPGLAIYGLYPENTDPSEFLLEQVLSLKSKIVFLKKVKKGTPISYGGRWVAPGESIIATVCIGYADGYQRILSNKAKVIINGEKCPLVGRVCMDMIMVDVTGLKDVEIGEEVILIGKGNNNTITAEDMAKWAGTINYEITTGISNRVPRIFTNEI